MKGLIALSILIAALFSGVIVDPVLAAPGVCPQDWHKQENINSTTWTITAPEGFLITATCVKVANEPPTIVYYPVGVTSVTLESNVYNQNNELQQISHVSWVLAPVKESTPTPTTVPSDTATPSETVTFTVTPTDTATFTVTPSETATPTASVTATSTGSVTPTDTSTPTSTGTITVTATFTNTPSQTPTATGTLTSTPGGETNTPTSTSSVTSTPGGSTSTPGGDATSTPNGTDYSTGGNQSNLPLLGLIGFVVAVIVILAGRKAFAK